MAFCSARCGVAILAIALASACLGTYGHRVDETREGLIGLDGHALRSCLGVPTAFTIDGDLEQQTYRYEHDDDLGEPYPPLNTNGIVITGGRGPERSYDSDGFPREQPDKSFCQLDFELVRGRVTRVSAQGRTREGMAADGSCMMRAEPCLAYATGDARLVE